MARPSDIYGFPPGIMPTGMAAYYVGCLSEGAFRAEMDDHKIKPVSLRGARVGWLIEDLDTYRMTKAKRDGAAGNEWLEAVDDARH